MNIIYNDIYSNKLFESVTDVSSGNTESVIKIGKIPMYVEDLGKIIDVDLTKIVDAVNISLGEISSEYPFMYTYIKYSKPMYVLADPSDKRCIHKTMAVDSNGNLWLNVHFIYNYLKCDKKKIFGILFHELMHNFLNHIERSEDIMGEKDRESLYKFSEDMFQNEMLKQNLCQDYEVNCNMVADGVVSEDFWKELHGMFDEKYFGKMWEDIYQTDGDMILNDYLKSSSKKLPEHYAEMIKAILEAMKILRNPKSTQREKDIALSKLKDIMSKLFGDSKHEKITIRKKLQGLQIKLKIKEIGEIGPYLKNVIDDLSVSPENMTESDLDKFSIDVSRLKDEMLKYVDEISEQFSCSSDVLFNDISDCMDKLLNGITRINKEKDLSEDEIEDINDEIIYSIDKLLADNIKKKELEKKIKKREEEKKKRREEKAKESIEKARARHILASYKSKISDLSEIYNHKRLSKKSFDCCINLLEIIEPLLSKITIEEIGKQIESIGISNYEKCIENLKNNLFTDLMDLKGEKVLWDRDEKFLKDICNQFYNDNLDLFNSFIEGLSETEMVSKVSIALSSIKKIGKELHRQAKVRPSKEYKEEYAKEYNRLRKIYMELGKKGLRRELGLPEE